jgi:hypothetical protein
MNLLEFYSLRFYCLSFFSLYHQNFIIQKLLQRSLEKKTHSKLHIFIIQSFFSLSTHLTNAALYAEHSSDFHSPAIVVRKLTYVF